MQKYASAPDRVSQSASASASASERAQSAEPMLTESSSCEVVRRGASSFAADPPPPPAGPPPPPPPPPPPSGPELEALRLPLAVFAEGATHAASDHLNELVEAKLVRRMERGAQMLRRFLRTPGEAPRFVKDGLKILFDSGESTSGRAGSSAGTCCMGSGPLAKHQTRPRCALFPSQTTHAVYLQPCLPARVYLPTTLGCCCMVRQRWLGSRAGLQRQWRSSSTPAGGGQHPAIPRLVDQLW